MFAGVQGAPRRTFPDPPYTTLAATPASREKPYLYVDATARGGLRARPRTDSGTTWAMARPPAARPAVDFFVARPRPPWRRSTELAQGKNLLLTPGVYDVGAVHRREAGRHRRARPRARDPDRGNGAVPMRVADVPGVDVAGLTIDAGTRTRRC